METTDPIAALSSPRLSERAAAGRDLAQVGTLDILPRLVRMSQDDPSPAVRLTAAAAAADILSRYRMGERSLALSAESRRGLLALFRGVDPGVNAGLFSMLAATNLPEAFQQIAVGLRDPRGGVRVGAAVGLMRLCMSGAVAQDRALEASVVGLLRDRRLPPDSLAEVARVAASVGYRSARPVLAEMVLSGSHGEAVEAALDVLASGASPALGAWTSDGRDAGEVDPAPLLAPALWLFGDASALAAGPDGWTAVPDVSPGDARRLYIRRVGEAEPGPAVQLGGRTFYPSAEGELLDAIDRATRCDAFDGGALPAEDTATPEDRLAAFILVDRLDEGGPALRARGLLLARAGRLSAAVDAFEAATQAKKTPADTWFFLGEVLACLDRMDEARAAWEAFLRKERRKKAPFLERANARLGLTPSA